jgi:ferredoxin--NADP+ reductase/benzoate/toluate 1,2-dioxygenase reductase subunit
VRDLARGIFVLRLERKDLQFRAGQWINVGIPGSGEQREYSIYSPPSADYLEVLVKEIPGGEVSPALHRCRPTDNVEIDGPHGSFTLVEGTREAPRYLFCATGTGVSPFHSFVRHSPSIDYVLLHGVRHRSELVDPETFGPSRFVPCISRESTLKGEHPGRLTDCLARHPVHSSTYCYLCGNSDMIYNAFAILTRFGIPREQIFAEIYF